MIEERFPQADFAVACPPINLQDPSLDPLTLAR